MIDSVDNAPRNAAQRKNMLANRAFVLLALIPLGLSCLLCRAFAPIDGFCPLDIFHVSVTPLHESLSLWRYLSATAVGVLLMVAVFKKPFGLAFLVVEGVAFLVLLIRLGEAMRWT
jgi:hypothetical protein